GPRHHRTGRHALPRRRPHQRAPPGHHQPHTRGAGDRPDHDGDRPVRADPLPRAPSRRRAGRRSSREGGLMASLPPQWVKGRTSRQAHADLPTGTVEEEHGREGFAAAASHLYRLHPPTAWTAVSGPLRPMALDANRLDDTPEDVPRPLLVNDDVRIGWWTRSVTGGSWF